ncbi:MAG: hypothetical protein QOJ92_372, partial [Frankiales bacterium]|nr:hypothetical protein [Frankiales bacterium]
MTDPFDGLRNHAQRTPPHLAAVVALGTRRRRQDAMKASALAAALAVVVGVAVVGGPGAGHDSLRTTGHPPATHAAPPPSMRPGV